MPAAKETIYIDVNDEITAIIDKVQGSKSKILALVLPKRASVFQSIVNMKLLKRTADQAKKSIVLITSEQSLLPLAGVVGLHVAKTLQSKPEIPAAPQVSDAPVSVDEAEELEEVPLDETAPVGKLAGLPEEETIEVDNDDKPVGVASAAKPAKGKQSYNKKLKVPNFDKFRTRLLIGGGIFAALLVFWVFATFIWPKATITLKTDTTDVTSTVAITAVPGISEVDVEGKKVPGTLKEYKKTDSTKVPATGQKDMGTKASGKMTFTTQLSCSTASAPAIPAGTTVTSGSSNFITQTAASFTFTGDISGTPPNVKCTWKTSQVAVIAQTAGDSYNLSARNYSVAGFSGVSGAGTAMSGGTSKIIKVVSQSDIDGAKQKLLDSFNASANSEITGQLKSEGYYPITDTFTTKEPLVTTSPAADAEADEVTVNVSVTYTMAGAQEDGVKQILEADIKKQIDTTKQNILNNGLDAATVKVDSKKDNGQTTFTLQTTAQAGVEQNEADIKQAIKGKKKGEVQSILGSRPGIKEVQVSFSPFWVSKVPKNDGKITLQFEQQGSQNNDGQ